MSMQPQPGEDPVEAARAILHKQIKAAIGEFGDDDKRSAEADVHGARKQLKRARAILRLLRDALDDDEYRAANTELRDAARPLSQVRDSEVLQEVLDGVVKRAGEEAKQLRLEKLQNGFKRQRAHLRQTAADRKQLANVQESLRRVDRRAQKWTFDGSGWPVLESGLKRIYRRGRKAVATAHSQPTTENLHEWRKQVKYLWHQLQALEPLSPGIIGELADEMHALSSYLGDDHDLAVLRERVCEPASGLDEHSAAALQSMIDRRREELRGKAFALGERLYSDKPKAFAGRLRELMR